MALVAKCFSSSAHRRLDEWDKTVCGLTVCQQANNNGIADDDDDDDVNNPAVVDNYPGKRGAFIPVVKGICLLPLNDDFRGTIWHVLLLLLLVRYEVVPFDDYCPRWG